MPNLAVFSKQKVFLFYFKKKKISDYPFTFAFLSVEHHKVLTMNQDLIRTALMGTSRSTPSVFLLEKAKTLGIKSDEVTEIVLEFAGITALMEKGGLILKDHDKTMPEPSIGETHRTCSIRSAAHLKEILEGKMDEAWGEFVFYCQEEKKIIPFEFLPQLIHYCRGDKKIWLALRPIVGQRGAWLVAQKIGRAHV